MEGATLIIATSITLLNLATAFFVSWALDQMNKLAGEIRDDLRNMKEPPK